MSTEISMSCKNCGELLAPGCIAGVWKHFNGSYYCSANRTHAEPLRENMSVSNPAPVPNESVPIWDLVIADMKDRDKVGRERYGTPLQTNNGRDTLLDAYQEALDLVVYLRQEIEERKQRCTRTSNS